ncbi:class I SAM-dependent methyltransferase [Rhodovulum adriaticum]|uniref:Methyltransferase family protein n=1 Tax=Rhodovulum adriaticum TaxID=35804 RepID=A0A4R2NLV7_RHOAD|nr:class I SAM-dependent methyltransferase [Rhodovulum adriaticum]MBK1635162.1 hypothetical protein [Rhodovulum adriaticum]TCP22275.1 methyltransferase family protein [Rhodovulum adriaticum]
MHLDVLDLRNFYYRTNLGRVAQRAIRNQVVQLWPDAKGQTVAGFGFAVPLLRPFMGQARRVIGLMPGQQGVMPWPPGGDNVSALCEETAWPLADGFVDKLVLLHGLETSEHPSSVLEESARVLGPGGRALFIVPNRSGLWARRDRTPFGFGRPYSPGQLEAQLRAHGFEPQRNLAALFAPPSDRRFWLRSAGMWETAGQRMSAQFAGGVLLVEASKRVYRPTGSPVREGLSRPLRVLEGLPAAGAEPA